MKRLSALALAAGLLLTGCASPDWQASYDDCVTYLTEASTGSSDNPETKKLCTDFADEHEGDSVREAFAD